jgi:tetratricopeptide (TPR) repeat protein
VKRLAFIIALTILLAPLAVRADEAANSVPAKARMLAARGRAAHAAGDYGGAIAAFTQAYAMAPAPALLFNLAQAYRLRGSCDDAALMYQRFLDSGPAPEVRSLVENHLATVERCMHKIGLNIPITSGPGARAGSVAGRGSAGISVDSAGSVTAARARKAALEKDVGIGLVIGGTASLALATYYAFQAHNAASDVADAYAKGAKWKDVAPLDARGKTASSRARLLGVGGALGVAGGVITYLIGRHTERSTPVTVVPRGRGVEVGLTWAF